MISFRELNPDQLDLILGEYYAPLFDVELLLNITYRTVKIEPIM